MFQLCEAVLEQRVLSGKQLFSCVGLIFEYYRRWIVLEARHLEGLHHNLVVVAR